MTSSRTWRVLGVETSCDDTAAGVVALRPGGGCALMANAVWSQYERHRPYGGVVPEIAARSHVERVDLIIARAMEEAGLDYSDLDGIAVTAGPGLVGGVMVGLTAAKAVALAHDLPLIPVNHLEGHALSPRIADRAPFPYLLLLVSGGHSQLLEVRGLGDYVRLGTTIDDAVGEAFDKTAKLLGLGQPGGPNVERAAAGGRADRFDLPRPLLKRPGADFSFSGLKTAVRLAAEDLGADATAGDVADLAASFQAAAAAHLARQTEKAMTLFESRHESRLLAVAGGVAANKTVNAALGGIAEKRGWRVVAPPSPYCTDNGVMIALAGAERLAAGLAPSTDAALAFAPRARWPLAEPPEGGALGGGRKGPKA